MTLKILVDMNLSPGWVPSIIEAGWPAVHWSEVGDPRADDQCLMQWAREHGYVVFTHDLDFGLLLALTHDTGPSVIQLRSRDVLPGKQLKKVVAALSHHEIELETGALVVIEGRKNRIRILPIQMGWERRRCSRRRHNRHLAHRAQQGRAIEVNFIACDTALGHLYDVQADLFNGGVSHRNTRAPL